MSRHEAELQKFFKGAVPEHMKNKDDSGLSRIQGPLVTAMLDQIGLTGETNEPFVLFDNACGLGVVAAELQSRIGPEVLARSSILCGDISASLIDATKERIEKEAWVNTEAKVIDAQDTSLAAQSFTHITTNIGFHVIPDSEAALKECIRILEPGGTLGFTTWHKCNPGWVPDVKEAFESLPFEAPFAMSMQTTKWGDWGDVNWVRNALVEYGLEDVHVEVQAHLSPVENAKVFVNNAGVMIDWMMNANWSEETRKAHGREEVMGLIEAFLEKKYAGRRWDLTWVSIIAIGRVSAQRLVQTESVM